MTPDDYKCCENPIEARELKREKIQLRLKNPEVLYKKTFWGKEFDIYFNTKTKEKEHKPTVTIVDKKTKKLILDSEITKSELKSLQSNKIELKLNDKRRDP